jgi:hypothetical protein
VTTKKGQRGIGAVYGTSRDRAFDRWFRYPAGFSPEALQLAARATGADGRSPVIDPFCGAGTTACGLTGRTVVGIEAHPLIADLTATKLAPPPGPSEGLRQAAAGLVTDATEASVDVDREHPLVRRCFEPNVLQTLASLREAITAGRRSPWRRYLRWALLGTLRDVASVKVGWPYQRPAVNRVAPYSDPAARLLARAEMIADDLATAETRPSGRVIRGDARTADAWRRAAAGERFDACITSPPYLNNFDYADATRLELYFLGTVSSWGEMCNEVRSGMVVATTQQSRRSRAVRALAELRRFSSITSDVVRLTDRLGAERESRARGKEYDQVLPAYFADLARVLRHLHTNTAPGAFAAWVIGDSAPYGVYIDTPRLVGALAGDIGFSLVDDVAVRSRGMRWRENGSRHQVPLTERLITFRRV